MKAGFSGDGRSLIVKKDVMPVSELLELTRQKKNEFSQYRERLRDKGLIDISERGLLKFVLPRFDKFIGCLYSSDRLHKIADCLI